MSSIERAKKLVDPYADLLCEEIKLTAEIANKLGLRLETVYFGGGTPSLLGGARIARIVDTVRAHYALEPDAEITAEANPDSMTDDFLTVSRASGVNRLSMGIQSANDRELRAIGRIHTFAQAQDAFFRASGFAG